MMQTHIPPLQAAELSVETMRDESALRLLMKGTADARAMDPLDDLLGAVHQAAQAERTDEVIVDLRSLEFMNSSCFKAFVSWLNDVQELDADKRYRIRFLSDEGKHWQRRSLGALACFAVDLITVET